MAYTTIDDPEAYFQVQLYTGDGAANHAITLGGDTDMQPDLVWIKSRVVARVHCLFDAVRGATKVIHSNSAVVESTDTDTLDAFQSDGFKVDADDKVNTDAKNHVAYCWKAGTTSGLSGGDITPSGYSINTTSKFGIYAYTGTGSEATITHGLGAVPQVMIIKKRNEEFTGSWPVHHGYLASNSSLYFNSTNGQDTSDLLGTDPTASVFSVDSEYANKNTFTYVAYLFADVQGFSKFGGYTGNGNADGPFLYTGFRPAWVIIKRYDAHGESWIIHDNKRSGYNGDNDYLYANTDGIDVTSANLIDILSNGFKARSTNGVVNASGATYVYMAWAEAPFVNSNGVPCNAR